MLTLLSEVYGDKTTWVYSLTQVYLDQLNKEQTFSIFSLDIFFHTLHDSQTKNLYCTNIQAYISSQASFGFAEILGPSVGGIMYDAGGFLLPFEVSFKKLCQIWQDLIDQNVKPFLLPLGVRASLPLNRSVHSVAPPHSDGQLQVFNFLPFQESPPRRRVSFSSITSSFPFNKGPVFPLSAAFHAFASSTKSLK